MTTHETIQEDLAGYVWCELDTERCEQVRGHLATCAECRAEVAQIREIRNVAAELPRGIAPARDLWAGIEERLEPRDRTVIPLRVRVPRVFRLSRSALAAAAILLVAATSALTALLMRGDGAPGLPAGTVAERTQAATPVTSALVAFRPAEAEYERAAEELETLLDAQRARLAPETVATVEANLRIVDRAIAEARAALEADPYNRQLTQMLSAVHETKVEMLRQVVQL